jgi:hypothetical protein
LHIQFCQCLYGENYCTIIFSRVNKNEIIAR